VIDRFASIRTDVADNTGHAWACMVMPIRAIALCVRAARML
jgi:hypothetical protein